MLLSTAISVDTLKLLICYNPNATFSKPQEKRFGSGLLAIKPCFLLLQYVFFAAGRRKPRD